MLHNKTQSILASARNISSLTLLKALTNWDLGLQVPSEYLARVHVFMRGRGIAAKTQCFHFPKSLLTYNQEQHIGKKLRLVGLAVFFFIFLPYSQALENIF